MSFTPGTATLDRDHRLLPLVSTRLFPAGHQPRPSSAAAPCSQA